MSGISGSERLSRHRREQMDFIRNAKFVRTGGYKCRIENDGAMPLEYFSDSYCDMMGYSQDEIIDIFQDDYTRIVSIHDLKSYRETADVALRDGGIVTARYLISHKDGSVLHVVDSLKAVVHQDKTVIYGTVEDVTPLINKEIELERANKQLRDFNEEAPFGILEIEVDDYAKITYMNSYMLALLGLDAYDYHLKDQYAGQNARLIVVEEDLHLFDKMVERALSSDEPFMYDFNILKRNGQAMPISGWAMGKTNEDGNRTIRVSAFNVTSIRNEEMQMRIRLCTDVLGPAFENLLLMDTHSQSAQSLNGKPIAWMGDDTFLSFSLTHTIDRWIELYVGDEVEKNRIRTFLEPVLAHPFRSQPTERFPVDMIRINGIGVSGRNKRIGLAIVYLGDGKYLFCQYDATPIEEAERVHNVIRLLDKRVERTRQLIFLIANGVIELKDLGNGMFRIDHAEGLACKYFGVREIDLMSDTHIDISASDLIGSSLLTASEFQRLLDEGYVELGPSEGVQMRDRVRIRCLWNDKLRLHHILFQDMTKSRGGEVLSYDGMDIGSEEHDVYIRTFGHFEVFVDGTPIAFNHAKSKELLALLVDRRGGFISSNEAISYLWEDALANTTTHARYRKVAMRLKNILERHGIGYIIETKNRSRRIVTRAVRCDLYDYLWGGKEHEGLFKGSYILDYSWAEVTLSELINENLDRLPEYPREF